MTRAASLFLLTALAVFGLILAGAPDASACDNCSHKSAEAAPAAKAPKAFDKAPAVGAKATCPVMGGEFTVTKKSERSQHKGKHVVFCCPGCKSKFDSNPEKYL
jgi:YHS domain-containing protein